MNDDSKKSVWPWIVALLIGLWVLYVLSFGPATFLWYKLDQPEWLGVYMTTSPNPVNWMIDALPAEQSECLRHACWDCYCDWWGSFAE